MQRRAISQLGLMLHYFHQYNIIYLARITCIYPSSISVKPAYFQERIQVLYKRDMTFLLIQLPLPIGVVQYLFSIKMAIKYRGYKCCFLLISSYLSLSTIQETS